MHLPDLELTAAKRHRIEDFLRVDSYGSVSELSGKGRRALTAAVAGDLAGAPELLQRQADMPWRRWEAWRRAALAEHPGGEYLGGGLVWLPDGHVARCSAVASSDGLRADERRHENLAVLERMAAEVRRHPTP